MRVDDRPPDAIEAGIHRRAHPFGRGQLFFDALEDQDVRIDADADNQDETGNAGQRHGGAEIRHHPEQNTEVHDDRGDGVQAGQLVVEQDEEHDDCEASEGGRDARLDRFPPERRPDGALLENVHRRRQRAGAKNEREVLRLLLGKAPCNPPFVRNARLDGRRRKHAVVENDREAAADVLLREQAEPPRAVLVKREADGRKVVLVECGTRRPEVASGDGRHTPHDVVHGSGRAAARRGQILCARDDHHLRRQDVIDRLHRGLLARERPLLYELQLEQRRPSDDLLRAIDIGDARQLHQNLVGRALPRDDRLRHTQLVDATLDGLLGLRDRLLAKLDRNVRPHRIGVAARAGRPAEHGVHLDSRLPECLVVLDTFGDKLGRARHFELRVCHGGDVERLAEPLGSGFGFNAQRGVGLHAHDEMDPAFQIEAEIHLLAGWIERPDRQGDHRKDEDDLPAQIFFHDLLSTTGSWPW